MAGLAVGLTAVGIVVPELLKKVKEMTKTTINCKKDCKALHDRLEQLQPIVENIVRQISQSNPGNGCTSGSAGHAWLVKLEEKLKSAETEVNKCTETRQGWNLYSRYMTGRSIRHVSKIVEAFLKSENLAGLDVMLSELNKVKLELNVNIQKPRDVALQIEFANVTQKSFEESSVSTVKGDLTFTIRSAFQNLSMTSSDGDMDEIGRPQLNMLDVQPQVNTGASSSSPCRKKQRVHEDAHKFTDLQQVPRFAGYLDELTMKLKKSIISENIDADSRSVGVWGMGGAGKTLLAKRAYNSREVRQHFEGAKLVWLTVSKTPNMKELYDSFCRQLRVPEMKVEKFEEYKNRLFDECRRKRVFLVLDDVWEGKHWEQLDVANSSGSVTLVTTRNQPVLGKARVEDKDQMKVGVLSAQDSLQLFCMFVGNVPDELRDVAKSMADECKGFPLALKVIGRSMIGKKTNQEWMFTLKRLQASGMLPNQTVEEELFGRLKISFDDWDNDDSHPTHLGWADGQT